MRHPSKKFCGPRCKDRFHNENNPRGIYAHLKNARDPNDDESWDEHNCRDEGMPMTPEFAATIWMLGYPLVVLQRRKYNYPTSEDLSVSVKKNPGAHMIVIMLELWIWFGVGGWILGR